MTGAGQLFDLGSDQAQHHAQTEAGAKNVRTMTRVNLSIPEPLLARVREQAPDLNLSEVLRDALGQLELCSHADLECRVCHAVKDRHEMIDAALSTFYDALHERVAELVYRGDGTAEGAMRIMAAVGRDFGVSMVERRPLPRPSRKARQDALASKLRSIDAPPVAQARARRGESERRRATA